MLLPSPLEEITLPLFKEKGLTVYVKRDDLIHPEISGNKWRKLKYNLQEADKQKLKTLLTFGGAYSNHIAASAAVGKLFDRNIIGVIRGEETLPLNPTLQQATEDGMQLFYASRSEYKKKNSTNFIELLKQVFGDFYLIPEGGGNKLGVKGCQDIVTEIDEDFDYILTDCGTGATLAGICNALTGKQKVIGIPVLKGGEFIEDEVKTLLEDDYLNVKDKLELQTAYHFGGYAKYTMELIDFMRDFYTKTKIKTDPIYTGKLFYAFMDLVKKNHFPQGSKIVVVHTGGLQGISGFEERFGFKIYEDN